MTVWSLPLVAVEIVEHRRQVFDWMLMKSPSGDFGACFPAIRAYAQACLPMTCVTADEAAAFCEADKARLPELTEVRRAAMEWDKTHHKFPWGNRDPTPMHINAKINSSDTTALHRVGSASAGRGAFGHFDLLGNAREWVIDGSIQTTYGGSYKSCASSLCGNSPLDDTTWRVVPLVTGDAGPDGGVEQAAEDVTGFRCARDL